jgi:V/A-type H+-transporting ATPase subunit I
MAGKKIKALKSMSGLGGLIMICGLSATIFGFLYGSVFGFEEEFLGIKIHPLWMNPIHNILTILMVAIGAGIVMLIIAFLLSILNSILARDWPHLLFGHTGIAGFLLYISFLGLIGTLAVKLLPIPPIVFIVLGIISGLAVMFSEVFINLMEGNRPLIEGGLGTYFIQAPMELFEAVISMLSNSLSFVRVGAFAVAHGGLSSVFFILAALVSPTHGVGYWIMLLIGNIFIVGFEGLIVAIQTMRLHYYEFLGKFFTGGGMRFEPLTLQPAEKEQA